MRGAPHHPRHPGAAPDTRDGPDTGDGPAGRQDGRDGPGGRDGATAAAADPRRPGTGAGRGLAWLLLVTGLLGLLASFVITLDAFRLLEDPDFAPACDISPVLSCGSVTSSEQASLFGVPNPLIGLAAYAAVATTGVALVAGARLPRWFWLGLNAGTLVGVAFSMWLMTQALYVIGALCLWCVLTWAATILMFWYTTLHTLGRGLLRAPAAVVGGLREFHWVVPAVWLGGIGMLVATRWWTYWQGLW
ncbi:MULTISPECIES: vitamin K epoxide reductase family protein [unclassified Streptomyces]|uniref:vitamin K epoxide reductase family protein n=1 Tax=unclassified Streptomyces TaxID=2593676 RepID=UPI0009A11A8F|nr:vitamin K epoxide reductase family protein [Streptomyces sp. C8S0]